MRIGPYQVERELGRGGMGAVYLARRYDRPERLVAVKVIHSGIAQDEDAERRFEREGVALASLSHPHLVRLHERGQFERGLWIAMDYVEGEPLDQRLRHQGLLSSEAARELLLPLCDALDHAHAAGVLHRDLKPANVLLRAPDDHPLLVDFGLALPLDASQHLTQTGEILGSPGYLSPEQCGLGVPTTPATDVYGLGALLYAMLTGLPPHRGKTLIHTLDLVLNETPRSPSKLAPDLDPSLEAACLRCLAKDPAQRFATPALLAEALRGPGAPARRTPALSALLALGLLAAAIGLGLWLAERLRPSETARATPRASAPAPTPTVSPLPVLPTKLPGLATRAAPLKQAESLLKAGELVKAWDALDDADLAHASGQTQRYEAESTLLRARLFEALGHGLETVGTLYAHSKVTDRSLGFRGVLPWLQLLGRSDGRARALILANTTKPPADASEHDRLAYHLERCALIFEAGDSPAALHAAVTQTKPRTEVDALPRDLQAAFKTLRALAGIGDGREQLRQAASLQPSPRWRRLLFAAQLHLEHFDDLARAADAALEANDSLFVEDLVRTLQSSKRRPLTQASQLHKRTYTRFHRWLAEPVNARAHFELLLRRGDHARARGFLWDLLPPDVVTARLHLKLLSRTVLGLGLPCSRKVAEEAAARYERALLPQRTPARYGLLACFYLLAADGSPRPSFGLRPQLSALEAGVRAGIEAEPTWSVLREGLVRCLRLARELSPPRERRLLTGQLGAAIKEWVEVDPDGLGSLAQAIIAPNKLRNSRLTRAASRSPLAEALARPVLLASEGVATPREWIRACGEHLRSRSLLPSERGRALVFVGRLLVQKGHLPAARVVQGWSRAWTRDPAPGEDDLFTLAFDAELRIASTPDLSREERFRLLGSALNASSPWAFAGKRRSALLMAHAKILLEAKQYEACLAKVEVAYRLTPSTEYWLKIADDLAQAKQASLAGDCLHRALAYGPLTQIGPSLFKRLEALDCSADRSWSALGKLLPLGDDSVRRGQLLVRMQELVPRATRADWAGQVLAAWQRSPARTQGDKLENLAAQVKALVGERERLVLRAQRHLLSTISTRRPPATVRASLSALRSAHAEWSQAERDAWRLPEDEARALIHLAKLSPDSYGSADAQRALSTLKAARKRGVNATLLARLLAQAARLCEDHDMELLAAQEGLKATDRAALLVGARLRALEGEILLDQGKPRKALESLHAALTSWQLDPAERGWAFALRAVALLDVGDEEGAVLANSFTYANIRNHPRPDAWLLFAESLIRVKQSNRARPLLDLLQRDRARHPPDLLARLDTAFSSLHRAEGRLQDAEALARQALKTLPNLPAAHEALAEALNELSRVAEAKEVVEAGLVCPGLTLRMRARLKALKARLN